MTLHMTYEQKQMARRMHAKGMTVRAIARELNYTSSAVHTTVMSKQLRPGRPDEWTPRSGRLRADEREDILIGIARGDTLSLIARRLGRAPSTVTREVAKNGGPSDYHAWQAHCRAKYATRRPRPPKLSHPPLKAQVTTWLEELESSTDRGALALGVPRRFDDVGVTRPSISRCSFRAEESFVAS